jgi:uncharacterized membrane protein YtjA (UPF0391 family)
VIASGLIIEIIAGAMVVAGIVADSVPALWASTIVVLVGLTLVVVGLRRARPSRRGIADITTSTWSASGEG